MCGPFLSLTNHPPIIPTIMSQRPANHTGRRMRVADCRNRALKARGIYQLFTADAVGEMSRLEESSVTTFNIKSLANYFCPVLSLPRIPINSSSNVKIEWPSTFSTSPPTEAHLHQAHVNRYQQNGQLPRSAPVMP